VTADQQPVVDALSSPATYGLASSETVERNETHGAIVFLAGERAYKLKRAVKYPYLDYSTPELRRKACLAELDVNRRAAPELYLAVKAVVRDDARLKLSEEPGAEAVDWVLVMRRFQESDLLEQQRRAGKLTPEMMRSLAETIAAFHASAEKRPDFGGAGGIAGILDENMSMLEGMAGRVFDRTRVDALARLSWMELERLTELFDRRRDAGLVRRCHGDLHLNNICLIDGRPTLFDAIEFSEEFASIDVVYDLAFLVMDLDRHGLRALANALLNRYLEISLDYDGLAALPLFLSCRAAIRAHVAVTRAEAMHAIPPVDEARSLLQRAIGYISGTGKTTVARAVAPTLGPCPGAVIVRSDVTRKRLAGGAETARLSPSGYTPAMNDTVFAALAETAGKAMAARHGVILDAVYGEERHRAALEEVARQAGVRFDGVWLTAPPEILEKRIGGRRGDASDATADVMRSQLQRIQKPPTWTAVDASGPAEPIAEEIKRRLD
jgi:uncharacterized protein